MKPTNSGRLIGLLSLLLAASAQADTFSHDGVHRKMESADLVAEIVIVGRSAIPHPVHFTVTHADAQIERIVSARSRDAASLQPRDHIVIEAPGGERGGIGVTVSGYPRPYNGHRYLAHLNKGPGGVYFVAGFHHGLEPLDADRGYSRNRTDGTNGEGNGPYLRWDNDYLPIPYFVDAESFRDHGDYIPAIDAAFRSWRDPADIKVEFIAIGCTHEARVENDGVNNVILMKTGWQFDSDAIAINRSFYVAGTEPRAGIILDSDIILNAQGHEFTTTNQTGHHDVQNIVTHEVGHLLGLGHEVDPKDIESAMYPFANPNEFNKRTLSGNDLAGIRAIYNGVGNKLPESSTLNMCQIPSTSSGCAFVPPCAPPTTTTWVLQIVQWLLMCAGLPVGRRLTRIKG